jgi:hypothetical protein
MTIRTLLNEKLFEGTVKGKGKRIRLFIMKVRRQVVIRLSESDFDTADPGWESFVMFQSWEHDIARLDHPRVTDALVARLRTQYAVDILTALNARTKVLAEMAAA